MIDANLANYMFHNRFQHAVTFLTTTPVEVFGQAVTKSLRCFGVLEGGIDYRQNNAENVPHQDIGRHRCDSLMVQYLVTVSDSEHLEFLGYADRIIDWLAVTLGKQIRGLAYVNVNGTWKNPQINDRLSTWNREIPFVSDSPRVDSLSSLDFSDGSFAFLEQVIFSQTPTALKLHAAASFYSRAINDWLTKPEQAYLGLVAAGECLASCVQFDWEELADPQTKDLVRLLEDSNHPHHAKSIKAQRRFLAKRFTRALEVFAPESTFNCCEYATLDEYRLTAANLQSALKNAYGLRSKYVHAGISFGKVTSVEASRSRAEVWPDGKPVWNGATNDINKIVSRAATFLGLERIVRAGLIRAVGYYKDEFSKGNERRFEKPASRAKEGLMWVKVGRNTHSSADGGD